MIEEKIAMLIGNLQIQNLRLAIRVEELQLENGRLRGKIEELENGDDHGPHIEGVRDGSDRNDL